MIEDEIKNIPGAEEYMNAQSGKAAIVSILSGILLGISSFFAGLVLVGTDAIDSLIAQIKSIPLIGESIAGEVRKVIVDFVVDIFFESLKTSLMISGIVFTLLAVFLLISYFHLTQKANAKYAEYKNTLNK
jgi:hypothetical protein